MRPAWRTRSARWIVRPWRTSSAARSEGSWTRRRRRLPARKRQGGPADAAAARLHAWVASALAAADAAAHARAGDDEAASRALSAAAAAARRARRVRARRPPSKRRARTPASPNQTGPRSPSRGAPPASLAADVVVTSKLRDRFGPDPRRSSGQREAWLVSVVAKPDGSFEARAYHPGTSVELSLPVPRAAAPAGKNPDRWAADVLPSKPVLDMGSGRPELVLRVYAAHPREVTLG